MCADGSGGKGDKDGGRGREGKAPLPFGGGGEASARRAEGGFGTRQALLAVWRSSSSAFLFFLSPPGGLAMTSTS